GAQKGAGRRYVPGQEYWLALAQPVRLGLRQGQRRDVVQRGLDGGQGPEKRGNMPEGLQFGKRNGRLLAEWPGGGPTQETQMSDGPQGQRQIAAEGPDVGALAAGDHEICMVRVRTSHELDARNDERPRLHVARLA